ncbi:MAG TPA: DUF1697 domain-containing protein [Bryobacteraceae bacterium]|nr:DUF1697 domain-containing protein [Bryobacteraceae bacterium]
MGVVISLLRGINLGGRTIKMDALRALYESIDLSEPQTYVASGNVIFKTKERNLDRLRKRIEDAIEKKFGFHSNVILRTTAELRDTIARNPFAKRSGIEPGKFLVTFLGNHPDKPALERLGKIKADPEELHIDGRELYIYFPNGAGRSKLPWASVEKILGVPGTARNWNSVVKMLEIAEKMEGLL